MEKGEYLNISKASDIKNPKEKALYRFFEMIPGVMSLGTLLGVLVFSWLFPAAVAVFIICFCFYYLFRVFYFSVHQIVGYFRTRGHMKKDWLKELKKAGGKDWKKIYHIVILTAYREREEIIRESIECLIKSNYPKEKIIAVLAVEQRAGKKFEK